jgi:nicotinate phosphoribosyltransferase
MARDVLALATDREDGSPLLQPVMRSGKRVSPSPALDELRARAATELAKLPEHVRHLEVDPPYPVEIARSLRDLARAVDEETARALPPGER